MASTIKLKTSTSSGNVPASLSKGEVAINVADGVWYYGGASAVQQNFTFGSVTVTGDTSLDGKLVVTGNTVLNGTLSASSVNVGNGAGSISANTITAAGTIEADLYSIQGVNAIDFANNTHLFGSTAKATKLRSQQGIEASSFINITAAGTALIVTGNTVMNGTLSASSINVGNGDGSVSAATITSSGDMTVGGDLDVDGVFNVDNMDIDGTFTMDGTTFDVNATTTLTLDNTNTTNGIAIGTSTSGVPIQLGHSTSETRVNDNLVVTGNTVMNGTLSATTSCKIGNGDGLISAATVSAPVITGTLSTAAQTNITSLGTLTNLDVDNININGDRITASGDMELVAIGNDINVDTDNFTIESATSVKPSFTLKTTVASNKPAVQSFVKDKGAAGADGDFIGDTYYIGDNDAQEQITMVQVSGLVSDASDGAEEGEYVIKIKNTAHVTAAQESFKLTGNGALTDATIGYGTTSTTTIAGDLVVTTDLDVDGITNLDNTDIDGTFTMDGTAFDVNGTTTVAIDNTNTTNGVTINTVTSGSKVFIGHTTSETTVNDNLNVTGDLAVDGTANLDNTDIDGTLVVDGSNISLDSTSTLNIDNSNTSNGITIGTATSGVPIQLGHSTSNVRINDNLVVTGNTVMNGTLSATTSLNVGNGNGTISAATINGVTITGTIGSDASPVTAYINNGEIDNVTLGSENAVTISRATICTIIGTVAESTPLSITGADSQSEPYLNVATAAGDSLFSIPSNGRVTIPSADINGGAIDGTPIGATSRRGGAFTTLDANSTLVVTGNTVLNGTLSATTSAKIGNGDGLVSAATVTAAGSVTLPDNGKVKLGNAGDLEIYHDGSNSYIDDTGTGTLKYRSGTQTFMNADGSKTMAVFNGASTVDLSFNDSVKLSTNTSGVHIAGTLSANTSVLAGTGVGDGVISGGTVQGSFQFITFLGNCGALSNDNWKSPGTNGISNHTWGTDTGGSGVSTGSSTFSIGRTDQHKGIRVPAGARLVGLEGAVRSNVNDQVYAGLFTYLPDYEGPDASDATLKILAHTPSSSNNLTNDPQSFKTTAAFADQHVFAEGECIVPAFRRDSTSSQSIIGSMTIILKY